MLHEFFVFFLVVLEVFIPILELTCYLWSVGDLENMIQTDKHYGKGLLYFPPENDIIIKLPPKGNIMK